MTSHSKPNTSEIINNQVNSEYYKNSQVTPGDIRANRLALGEALKNARVQSGMSEDAIAQVTRITRGYIVALESGEFEKLPGAVFGRGFVRSIAKLLGLDQDEMSKLYAACWATDEMQKTLKAPVADGVISQKISARKKLNFDIGLLLANAPIPRIKFDSQTQMALLIAAPVIAVLSAITVVAVRQSDKSDLKATSIVSAQLPSAAESVPADGVVQTVANSQSDLAVQAQGASQAQNAAQEEPAMELNSSKPSFEQVLELVVIEPVKVKLVEDSKVPSVRELKPDAYRFTFSDRAELTVYDAAAVEVAYNGRSLGSLGSKGRIRKLIFQTGAPREMPAAAQAADPVGENAKKL
jgi:cytoskeletal protein RodZ